MTALTAIAIGAGCFGLAICLFILWACLRAEMLGTIEPAGRALGGKALVYGVVFILWIGSWMVVRWLA